MTAPRLPLFAALATVVAVALAALGCGGAGSRGEAEAPPLRLGIVLPSDFTETETIAPALDLARVRIVWNRVQPNCRMIRRGEYRWEALDRDLGRFTARGVPLLVTIRGGPACASEKLDGEPREPKRTYWGDFARFAAKAAVRYGPAAERGGGGPDGCCGVEQLEIWNEPNIKAGWTEPDGRVYGRFLRLVAERVRAADTGGRIRIVSGGLAASNALEFTTELFSVPGIADSFDDYGLHTYNPTPNDALDLVAAVRNKIDASGDATPIAISEHGWSTCPRPSETRNRGKCTTTEGQAAKLEAYVAGLRERPELGVDAFLWYTPQDVARPANDRQCPESPKYHYGFFKSDGNPKPAWGSWVEATGTGDVAPDSLAPLPRRLLRDCEGNSKVSD